MSYGGASWLSDGAIIALAGRDAYDRARDLVRSGRVIEVELDDALLSVTGRVQGTYRDAYEVSVQLATSPSGQTTIHRAHCGCPVMTDCKHVVAVLLSARHALATAGLRQELPEWERTFAKVLSGMAPSAAQQGLGLEFGVESIPAFRAYAGRNDLRIRPVRRGRSGSWVRSGISWEDLDHVTMTYPGDQRELLLQLRAATGASARYTLPRNGWLSLQGVSSVLWRLLDTAAEVGLPLIASKPLRGLTRSPVRATVSLDARRAGSSGLLVGAQVLHGSERLDPSRLGVLGEPAHGIFAVTSAPGGDELVLARLEEVLSAELRQLLLQTRSLVVPAHDEPRFVAEFLPGLRRRVGVTSSDGSVSLPTGAPPRIGLTVSFRPEHRIRLDWTVTYTAGERTHTFAIDDATAAPVRDRAAELALLAALPLPYAATPQLLSSADPAPQPAAHALLDGLTAVAFVEETLPLIEKHGVEVTRVGEVLDYRHSEAEPAITVTAVERPEVADWFDLHVQVSIEGEAVPFDQLFVALTQGDEFLITDTGVCFALARPEFGQLRGLIEESKALADRDRPLSLNRFQVSLWSELVDLGVVIEQSARWSRTVRSLPAADTSDPVPPPPTLAAELRPYQLEGYRWLHTLWSAGLGGILADDMGLGKTVQTLALIARARLDDPTGPPFLVVAPTSVVSGWVSEAARFAPSLRTVPVTASSRRQPLAETVDGADVVVTSYAVLRLDADAYAEQSWSGMVLDEAQFVKNHRAKTYQAARRVPAPFKLAITGTPVENSLMDLWALLSITAPGLFSSPERFAEFYRRPIERHHDPDRLALLRRRIRPVMLRRTKQSVAAELPPKQEQVVEVELDPRHMRIYQTHLQRERQKVLGLIEDLDHNRFTILRSLTLLRRLSLDPALLDPGHAGVPAAKVEVLLADLAEITAEGHRALVFSQFTSFLGRIGDRLAAAGISYSYLDGHTRDRGQVIDRFRSGEASVFLISLKAGGFGLNLTEADYCFVLDPWWNPATEAQAVDRAHRIGQDKTVMVYRLVAKDTIEEKVMALKQQKERLAEAVLEEESLAPGTLTAEAIRDLLSV